MSKFHAPAAASTTPTPTKRGFRQPVVPPAQEVVEDEECLLLRNSSCAVIEGCAEMPEQRGGEVGRW